MKTEYVEVSLKDVMQYFANGFKPKDGSIVKSCDYILDAAQGRVIFKLFKEEPGESKEDKEKAN